MMEARRRTAEVRVKLSPAIADKVQQYADERGLPSATLAAAIIGEWVEARGRKDQIERMVALETTRKLTDGPFMASQLSGALEDVMRRLMHSGDAESGLAAIAGSSAGPEAAASTLTADQAGGVGDRVRTAT